MSIDEKNSTTVAFGRNNLLTVTCLLLLIFGCRKESDRARWDIDLLAPLAETTLTISDLLPDSITQTDSDNNIVIEYESVLFELGIDTLFQIPDTSFAYLYALPIPGPVNLNPGTQVLNSMEDNNLDLDPILLTEAILREGTVTVSALSKVGTPTISELTLTSALLAGTPLQMTLNIPSGSVAQPSMVTETRDVSGYSLDLTGQMNNSANVITNNVTLTTDPSGNAVSVTDQDSLNSVISYANIVPNYAKGYLGQRVETLNETVDISAFENLDGSFDLEQIKITLQVENGIGVDAQLRINALNSIGNSTIALNHPFANGVTNITRAIDQGGTGFTPNVQDIVIDNTNSNIDLFVENLPSQLQLDGELEINPLGNFSNGNDFIYYDSQFALKVLTEIPLSIIASNAVLTEVLEIELPGDVDSQSITEGTLHFFINNGFPLSAVLGLEVFGEPNASSSTPVPVSGSITSAQLDVNGDVVSPVESQVSVVLSEQDIQRLYASGKVRIGVEFDTQPTGQFVKFKESHFMDVQVTADFKYIVNGDTQ